MKKFSINSKELLRVLQRLSVGVSSHPIIPILDGYLFEVSAMQITVKTTDLDIYLIESVMADTKDEMSIVLPSFILVQTLQMIDNQIIKFEVNEKNYNVTMTANEGVYKFAGEKGKDFPKVPELGDHDKFYFRKTDLTPVLKNSLSVTLNDELRPSMSGVFFRAKKDSFEIVSTDAVRLYWHRFLNQENKNKTRTGIYSKKAIRSIVNTNTPDDMIEIEIGDHVSQIIIGELTIVTKLIDTPYPSFESIIPFGDDFTVKIKRSELLGAVKRVGIYCDEKELVNLSGLNLKGNKVVLKAVNESVKEPSFEVIDMNLDGEFPEIWFNKGFLKSVLQIVDGEDVQFKGTNKSKPVTVDLSDDNSDTKILLMPFNY